MRPCAVLLDGKADIDDVNRALLDVNGQLNLKASMVDISTTLQEQVEEPPPCSPHALARMQQATLPRAHIMRLYS